MAHASILTQVIIQQSTLSHGHQMERISHQECIVASWYGKQHNHRINFALSNFLTSLETFVYTT